tara:strand:+ start:354 stop:833 length:480 start_codon:yes stop_codon:yes gene_type:complete
MAHFAEIDNNNKVLRVVVGCNTDVDNNGGDQSNTAAEHFKSVVSLSENGVKWVQTSYNKNFRGNFAGEGFEWDEVNNIFWAPQPYASWTKDIASAKWVAPITKPAWTEEESTAYQIIEWDEANTRWIKESTIPDENNELSRWAWDSNSSSYNFVEKFTR